MMKQELKKKIASICEEIGTAAAAEQLDELTEEIDREFEHRVEEGQSELDAYRDILSNVDKIKEMLESLPATEAEKERKQRKKDAKKAKALIETLQACLWLLTVVAYFAVSFTFGHWHLTWLMFLASAAESVLLDMLLKYMEGTPFEKVMDSEFSGVIWLAIVIIYFLYSFTVGGIAWSYSWLIFILGAVIEVIRDGIRKARRE